MREAFILSLRLHGRWLREALGPRGRQVAPLTPYRLLVLALLLPAYALLQAAHWLGFVADELLFPGYRNAPVTAPLFITGIPRSGTTFVHRALAGDEASFTTLRTWEALFAPSVSERRLLRGIARLDGLLGRPLWHLAEAVTRRLTGGLAAIHEVGLEAAEEDYLTLLPAGGCFILVLAFPASPSLWRLGRLQELPAPERRVLVDFYRACLQKHLYAAPPGRRLLSKNAAFGSWLPELATRFPDARFLVCVREPVEALRSQLGALRGGLALFGTLPAADAVARGLKANVTHAYVVLRDCGQRLPAGRLAVIDQGRLRAAPRGELEGALARLGVPVVPSLEAALEAALEVAKRRTGDGEDRGHRHPPVTGGEDPDPGPVVARLHHDLINGMAPLGREFDHELDHELDHEPNNEPSNEPRD
ncbi:MAG: sulfotransferase [Gammaproteobacteria bacterium]|nr:sulfotransferase [Gammaproteobacteria bacterium]